MHTSLSKLVARNILCCVIPLILAAAYVSAIRIFDVDSTSTQRAAQLTTHLRVAIDDNLRSRIAGLKVLADSAEADLRDLSQLYQHAQVFHKHFGGLVLLTDTALQILFTTAVPLGQALPPVLPTPDGFAAAPYALTHGQTAVGDLVIAKTNNQPIVAIATPVVRDGQVRRVLLNTIETRWLQEFLDQLDLPTDWHVSVRDSRGALLAQHPAGKAIPADAKHWQMASEVSRWQVAVDIAPATFYRKHIAALLWTLLLLLVALGTSLWLGQQTARRLAHAMTTLHKGKRSTTAGETFAEVEAVRSALQAERESRAQIESALRESEQRWRFAIEGAGDGLWDWDVASGRVFYSSRWKSMLGYDDDEIQPDIRAWSELAHPDDKQRVLDAVQQHIDGQASGFTQEYRIRCKDGSWRWMLARGMALHDAKQPGAVRMIGVNSDITVRKEAEARIEYLAYYDPLTGLANRKLLNDRIQQALSATGRNLQHGSLLFIDLDGFKPVNDLWGHSVGDAMLIQVAQRIRQSLRTSDTVARIGGDEFVVVAQNLGTLREDAAERASAIAQKVLSSFYPPFRMGEHEFHGGASIGVTLFGDAQTTPETLLGQADSAMYHAKSEGGSLVRFFDSALQAALQERSVFEADLRQSIHRHQLKLVYQPQCRVDGSIIGAEALLRWQHPERGLISPTNFIPLAERDNFIVELGRWVLREACTTLAELACDPATRDLVMAVNVSPRQFLQPAFVAEVRDLLQVSGASPDRLKLELTESIFARDVDDIAQKMAALHKLGVKFSLDDFGTGYSCLAYLKKLPFDQIKIDQVFVSDLPNEPHNMAIVHAVIALSDSLSIGVIAEGVETAAQRDFLAQNGCHAFQGFLFGHPVDKHALMQLLAAETV